MIADGILGPMELGHLRYRRGKTFKDFVGAAGLKRHGKRKWKRRVDDVVKRLVAALEPEYVALGGGNADKVGKLPPNARLGGVDPTPLALPLDRRIVIPDTPRGRPAGASSAIHG